MRNIVLILIILTALALAWRIEGRRGPFFWRVLLLLGLALCVEVVGTVTSRMSLPNALLYNLYAALEFALLMDMVRVLRPRWQPGLVVVSLKRSVENFRASLFDKFHIKSKTGLVLFAMRWRLMDLG